MQAKLTFALCVIAIFINIIIVFGYIYLELEDKRQITNIEKVKHKSAIKNKPKKIEIETDKESDTDKAVEPVSLGEFKLTAYCSCEICCGVWANNRPNGIVYGAIGEELKEGYSIAVDPEVIPYRTEVIIDGKTYKAQDCGGAIKGNRIDVYFEDHDDALEFGVKHTEVFVKM